MHFFDSIKSILIISLIASQFLVPTPHANFRGVDQHINFNQSLQEVNYEVILCFWKLVLIPSPTIYSRPAKRAADLHDHRTHLPLTVTSAGDCFRKSSDHRLYFNPQKKMITSLWDLGTCCTERKELQNAPIIPDRSGTSSICR